ncbi:MAG: O-antigen ligase family protein [Candidatus Acidiferrales bacterium]|jgi:O-antigen ligase
MTNIELANDGRLSQLMAQTSIIAMICAAILVPGITFSQALPWFKAEQVLLPVIFLGYGLLLLAGLARTIRLNGMFVIAFLYTFSIILSIWYGSVVLGQSVILRDYYEFPKIWLPVIFFAIGYEAELSESSIRRLMLFLAAAIALVALYAWGQWASLGLTFKIDPYYSAGEHINGALARYRRVFSTMGNANVLGQLMTWSVAAYLLAFLSKVGNRARNLAVVFVCLVTLAMTGSRYGLLTTSLAVVMVLALQSASGRRRGEQLALLLLLIPVFALTIQTVATTNKSTIERFGTLQRPMEVDSLRTRLDDLWKDAGNDFAQSPFVGHGPAKKIYTDIITDSEYLDVLKEFGIIGFCIYLAYYLFPLYLVWNGLRSAKRAGPRLEDRLPAQMMAVRLSFIMIVTAMVMNIGETTFYSQVLQGFLWIWMGIGARAAKTIAGSAEISRPKPAPSFRGYRYATK